MKKKNSIVPSSQDKNFQIAWFISLLIGMHGLIMSLICFKDSNWRMVIISFGYGLLMFGLFIYINITKKLTPFYILGSAIVIFLEIDFLLDGGTNGFGIIWMTIIPLFTVYLFPYKTFFGLNISILLILILGLWTPLEKYVYDFNPTFQIRFPLVFLMDFLFS